MLAHEHVMPIPGNAPGNAAAPLPVSLSASLPVPLPVHYPAAEIERQLETLFSTRANDTTSGFALIFSSEAHEHTHNLLPTLTLSLNTLPAGEAQRPHRHNSAAITLVLAGAQCSTQVNGVRCDWLPWRTLITPPGALHSHHNDDTQGGRARFLIVQDGGLYYLGRTMGFSFADVDVVNV
jgi:gentisate 1,2-dioxygenase